MQAGYDQDAKNDTHATAVTWLDAWSDVLRLCDAAGIGSIGEFDDRFPLTQSLFNWSQDLEMALENAGRDDGELRQALIEFCEESLWRFPREDELLTENRRRALAGAYFDAGLTEKAGELFRSWLDANPAWGWGWIGWADCYLPWDGRAADYGRAEELLLRGYRVPGARDRADIVGHAARRHRADGQGGTQCPVPVRQREEVQEVLWFPGSRGEVRLPVRMLSWKVRCRQSSLGRREKSGGESGLRGFGISSTG
jgi:hypothetical protein